jgi:hypothetical protein
MYKLKSSAIILLMTVLISGSCKNSSLEDLSLTTKEYQKMGMPDQLKLSSNHDCLKVLATLNVLRARNPLAYPRKHSKKSGTVFSSFINKENLSFADDEGLALRDRALRIQSFSTFQNALIQIYTDKLKPEQYYNEELIDFYIYQLFLRSKMLKLAAKIMNSKDESDVSMQSGLTVVLNSYISLINLILEEQSKTKVYHHEDLERLSMEVSQSLIKNIEWIEQSEREEIAVKVQRTIENSTSGNIKNNYYKALMLLNEKGK